ncbi:hypothetical protein V2S66_31265 [Streptomyces sp. V4-01]|uniref:Uncharacterized protein n=1 Tax=Actinacidiphila polyblastidii TaxID=3110430 RepID=A0ABU7PL27_9ACTN|nr:hypothetical protein [Streptomyces sp. V4-01]
MSFLDALRAAQAALQRLIVATHPDVANAPTWVVLTFVPTEPLVLAGPGGEPVVVPCPHCGAVGGHTVSRSLADPVTVTCMEGHVVPLPEWADGPALFRELMAVAEEA